MNETPEAPQPEQDYEAKNTNPMTPSYSAEDARPQEQFPEGNKPVVVRARSRKKQFFVGCLVLVLLCLIGGAVYWFLLRGDSSSTSTSQQSETQQNGTLSEVTNMQPDTLSYGFADSSAAPTDIYWRLASGGDRTKVLSLSGTDKPSSHAIQGQHVAYVIDIYTTTPSSSAGVWYSSDGGRSFAKIYILAKDEQITSLQFASEGTELAIASLPAVGSSNTVKAIDLSTKQAKDLFKIDKSGVFLKGYSSDKKQVLYFSGCYNCDGVLHSKLLSYNLQSKTESTIVDAQDRIISSLEVNSAFNQIIYALATQDESQPSDDMMIGYVGAPYGIYRRDLSANDSTKLLDVGKLGDKTTLNKVGYIANNNAGDFYYAFGNQLFTKYSQDPIVFYEASQQIRDVYFVDANTSIAASGTYDNFSVVRFDLQSKTASTILQGDANTNIFGISTK